MFLYFCLQCMHVLLNLELNFDSLITVVFVLRQKNVQRFEFFIILWPNDVGFFKEIKSRFNLCLLL